MKPFLVLLAIFGVTCLAGAITHEVHPIYQPLSLHGTDVGEDFKGVPIQAKVASFPSVIVGAMPEALVAAIAAPHRLPGPESYTIPEVNLLILCGIKLECAVGGKGVVCSFDLKDLKIPEEVELPVRTVLELGIKSLRETLHQYYKGSKITERITVKITGTSERNASLKDLAVIFTAGK